MDPSRFPVAVLVSGGGSNLQAIIDASTDPNFAARIAVVIADRERVKALDRAATAGVPTVVVPWRADRTAFTAAVCDEADRYGVRALVLAGFMRVLGPVAMERFPLSIVNVHPSLLPSFPGAHAVRDALGYGVALAGVTIHFVDEHVDHGPIIYQESLRVLPDDDEATLHSRIQTIEHRALPTVVDALARGDLAVDGRHVTWRRR